MPLKWYWSTNKTKTEKEKTKCSDIHFSWESTGNELENRLVSVEGWREPVLLGIPHALLPTFPTVLVDWSLVEPAKKVTRWVINQVRIQSYFLFTKTVYWYFKKLKRVTLLGHVKYLFLLQSHNLIKFKDSCLKTHSLREGAPSVPLVIESFKCCSISSPAKKTLKKPQIHDLLPKQMNRVQTAC